MYVCTCNGVSEGRVEAAIREGARTARAVHAACGAQPQCGRCLPEIADRIRAARSGKREAFANTCQLLTQGGEQAEVTAPA